MPFSEREEIDKCMPDRHYDKDYNFILAIDSLVLQEDRPMHLLIMPETTDSVVVHKGEQLVVAQIEVIAEDSIDSVWIKVARDQMTQGWIHESRLLEVSTPDDPISQAIRAFSLRSVAMLSVGCFFVVAILLACSRERRRFRIVHVRDIASPYPMLLCLALTFATILYTSLLLFVPELWQHFYFHPTLNPFGQPAPLAMLLSMFWLIIILFIAAIDDIVHSLPFYGILGYVVSLMAVLATLCLFFFFATQHFVGYFLWAVYAIAAIARYLLCHRARYRCSRCGTLLHDSGQCTRCNG